MKLTETQLSKTLKMNDVLLYEPNVILDNGYGKYTHKLIIKYITKDRTYSSFFVLFNPDAMSAGLDNAFMESRIDLHDESEDVKNAEYTYETNIYYDVSIRENDQEHYLAFKEYVNRMNKDRNRDICFLYGIKINKGEYTASKGLYSTNVQGGLFKIFDQL